MTREEAREALSVLKIYDAQWLRQAVDMAIEALRQPINDDWERYSDFLWKEAYERGKQEALSANAESDDLIIKGAKGIKDGLYNIKDGKLFQFKAKGGTVRTYPIVSSADAEQGEWKFVDNEIFAGEYFCSICGKMAEVDLYGEWILSNYCPSCGVRMVKGGDDK